MRARTLARAITVTIAVTLTAIAVTLQADMAPVVSSAQPTVVTESTAGAAAAGTASDPVRLSINWQLFPCREASHATSVQTGEDL